jgi:hypothetical protein
LIRPSASSGKLAQANAKFSFMLNKILCVAFVFRTGLKAYLRGDPMWLPYKLLVLKKHLQVNDIPHHPFLPRIKFCGKYIKNEHKIICVVHYPKIMIIKVKK